MYLLGIETITIIRAMLCLLSYMNSSLDFANLLKGNGEDHNRKL